MCLDFCAMIVKWQMQTLKILPAHVTQEWQMQHSDRVTSGTRRWPKIDHKLFGTLCNENNLCDHMSMFTQLQNFVETNNSYNSLVSSAFGRRQKRYLSKLAVSSRCIDDSTTCWTTTRSFTPGRSPYKQQELSLKKCL